MLLNATEGLFSPRMRLGKHAIQCLLNRNMVWFLVTEKAVSSSHPPQSLRYHWWITREPIKSTNSGYLMQRKILLYQNLPEQSGWHLFHQILIFHSIQHVPAVQKYCTFDWAFHSFLLQEDPVLVWITYPRRNVTVISKRSQNLLLNLTT